MITLSEIKQRYTVAKNGNVLNLFDYNNVNEFLITIYEIEKGIYTLNKRPIDTIEKLVLFIDLTISSQQLKETLKKRFGRKF